MSLFDIFFGVVLIVGIWCKLTDSSGKPGVGEMARKKAKQAKHKEPPPMPATE